MALKRLTDSQDQVYGYGIYGTDHTGARYYETCRGSLRDAKVREAEIVQQVGKQTYVRPALKRITFGALWERYLASKTDAVRPNTLQNYRDLITPHVLPYLEHFELGRADFRQLIRQKNGLIDRLKAATYHGRPIGYGHINKILTQVYQVFDFARREGFIETNPVEKEDRPKERALPHDHPQRRPREKMRIIPLNALQRVIDQAEPGKQRVAILLGLAFGLRPGEIRALQWGEIDWLARAVNVVRAATDVRNQGILYYDPKTTRSASKVYLKDRVDTLLGVDVMAELKAWRLKSPFSQDSHLVVYKGWRTRGHLPTGDGEPYDDKYFTRDLIQPVFRRAGVEVHRAYDLRHTSISMVIHLHYTPVEIRDHARHTTYEFTVSRYGHIMMDVRPEEKKFPEINKSFTRV